MTVSAIEYVFWATGTMLYGALTVAALRKRQLLQAPLFTAWLMEMFLAAVVLFVVSRCAKSPVYATTYWLLTSVELLLQVAVAVELAVHSLPDQGTWIKTPFLFSLFGLLTAVILSCSLSFFATPATPDRLDKIYVHVKLLTSLVTVFFTAFTFMVSRWFGSIWRRIDRSRFAGFAVFACASAVIDSLHIYWRTTPAFFSLEMLQMLATQSVLVFWLVLLEYPPSEKRNGSNRDLEELKALLRVY